MTQLFVLITWEMSVSSRKHGVLVLVKVVSAGYVLSFLFKRINNF